MGVKTSLSDLECRTRTYVRTSAVLDYFAT